MAAAMPRAGCATRKHKGASMTNVVQFRKSPAAEAVQSAWAPPEGPWFVSALVDAAEVAGFVYGDFEAMDVLLARLRGLMLRGDNKDWIEDEAALARVAPYLGHQRPSYREDQKRLLEILYRVD